MTPPFSAEAFLQSIARYNEAVWPMPIVLALLALGAIGLALRPTPAGSRAIAALLAGYWLWIGVVYHSGFFTDINVAAWGFAALFIAQGLLFAWLGAWRGALAFGWRNDAYGWVGAALMAYALAVYPLLNLALGHTWPTMPTFGLPCPTTILTFGLLLWTRRLPLGVLAIPLLWAFIGGSAAFNFGIQEDYGLVLSGVVATVMLVWRERRAQPATGRTAAHA